jgi:hypothetical protein
MSISARDRFLGCLLGGGIGDALGAPVEFLSRSEILRSFGLDGIPLCTCLRRHREYHRRHANDVVHLQGAPASPGP